GCCPPRLRHGTPRESARSHVRARRRRAHTRRLRPRDFRLAAAPIRSPLSPTAPPPVPPSHPRRVLPTRTSPTVRPSLRPVPPIESSIVNPARGAVQLD